jgi:hypothetical protein
MTAIWDSGRYDAGALLVLLAMADYADEEHVCRPSVGALARKARLSERQIIRILNGFKADGMITPIGEHRAKAGRPITIYRINVDALKVTQASPSQPAKGDIMSPLAASKGDICAPKGDIAVSYDPPIEPPIEPSEEERAAAVPPAPAPAVVIEVAETAQTATATPLTLTTHPAIQAYHNAFLAWPSKAQMVEIIRHGVDDVARWENAVAAWMRAGHSPRNIGGMLDWYDNPARIPAARPHGAPAVATNSKVAASMNAVDQVLAMIERASQTEEVQP